MATPLALIIGIFLAEIAPPAIRNIAEPVLQLLAGIPAVVYGFVGYATLVPFMENWLPTGETLFCAAVVLALMVLPFIAATAAESFALVAAELRLGGLALAVNVGDRNSQFTHGREVRQATMARRMLLWEEHFLGRPFQGAPLPDVTLQSTQYAIRKALGMIVLQLAQQRDGHQSWRALEQRYDFAIPDLGKRIDSRTPIASGIL